MVGSIYSDSYSDYDTSTNDNESFYPPPIGGIPYRPSEPVTIPIPIREDPHNGYTFREYLVNNGIPYDGRDYVTRNRNDLILDGYFDDSDYDSNDHDCPKESGLPGNCNHPSHTVQVTSGIPDRYTGKRYPVVKPKRKEVPCRCQKYEHLSKNETDSKLNNVKMVDDSKKKKRKKCKCGKCYS